MSKKNIIAHMSKSVKNDDFDKKFGEPKKNTAELSEIQNTIAKKNVNADSVSQKDPKVGGKKKTNEIERLLSAPNPEGKSVQISFSLNEETRDKYVKLSKLYSLHEKDIEKYELMRLALYDWINKNYEKEYQNLIK